MKLRALGVTALLVSLGLLPAAIALAQEAGNSVYGGTRRNTSGVSVGSLGSVDPKDGVPAYFVEANVLVNVKADEYLAVFALAQEGQTVPEGNARIDAQVEELRRSLRDLGLKDADVVVDYISQNKVYDFDISGNTAREKLSGFQVKKNVAVRYKDKALLDRILAAASRASVFDLIKVDYVVSDMPRVRERLLDEATRLVARKREGYARLLGVKMKPESVFQEKYNVFFPSEMYSAYVAYQTGGVEAGRDMRVLEQRKTSTFYFNPLHTAEFDLVIDPAGAEPVVQCTLYLKVKCRLEP
jgi:uncharacterized protein YggE